jgi:hypothetical protein
VLGENCLSSLVHNAEIKDAWSFRQALPVPEDEDKGG